LALAAAQKAGFDLIGRGKGEESFPMRIPLSRSVLFVVLVLLQSAWAAPYPDRFVWVFGWGLRNEAEVGEVSALLETAVKSGLNGAVLSASLDTLCKESPDYFQRLDQVKATCDRLGLELIPSVFSVGYGGGALAHDRQLAEGLPVTDAPFLVRGREARLIPDAAGRVVNGGFEEYKGNAFPGYAFHDKPGVISCVDTQVFHSGRASMRLENFTADAYGHGRVMQKLRVQPHRCYRMSLWVKTEGLKPTSAFQISVLADHDRSVAPRQFHLPSTSDWRKLTFLFNSLEYDSLNAYAGVWGGKEGRLWLDDWSVEEVGPINALRREGTPFTVRSEDGTVTYVEGKDYAAYHDPEFNFYRIDRDAAPLRLLAGSRIQDGERLKVSWYHPMVIYESQVSVCMAEPELYEIYDHEAKLLAEHLHPRRVLLNMDEIRMGGTCERCRGKDMAQLLGSCITKQVESIRRYSPGAEIYVWSDMLDPNHNGHGNYYLVNGDFSGAWQYVPKDLVLGVWGGEPQEKSLRFFSEHGFQTLGACYYDAQDLTEVKAWLEVAQSIPNMRGFMYTPWLRKYELLPQFGALLNSASRPGAGR
jgi:hypothetical protein